MTNVATERSSAPEVVPMHSSLEPVAEKLPSAASSSDALPVAPPSRRYRNYVLGMLVVVYTMNFLDRQILGILAGSIKKDLGLSDGQIGLMGGLAFAMLYSTLGVPIAWLADRTSRRSIMAWAFAIWSGFTALCGLASGFWHLFLARIGVGIGEAGGVAPAYSMVSDYFPKEQRARALSIYSLGIPVGSACGILFGGLIAAKIDWRAAFIIVGCAGVLLAPIFRLTVKDPPRGGFVAAGEPAPVKAAPPSFMEVFRLVARKRTFWLLSFGAAASSVCGYGVAFWLPSFFMRSFHLTLPETSVYYASITLLGGGLGILMGGRIADRAGRSNRTVYPTIPAIAFMIAMPCFFAAVNMSNLWIAFPLFLIPTGLNLAWLGPVITAVQHLVPAHMRTTASAMFLLINNLFGIAIGYYYFGAVSDALKPHFGAESLRYAIYTGLGFYVISSCLLLLSRRSIKRDWVD